MTKDKSQPVILAADDDEDARFLLDRAFVKSGSKAALIQVNDGSEVIKYLAGEGNYSDRSKYPIPDVLLLDLKMPRTPGFEVLEHLKQHPFPARFPVLVFSSSDADQDIKRAYALGCDAYIVKPTNLQKLFELVCAIDREFFGAAGGKCGEGANFSRFVIPREVPLDPVRQSGGIDSGKRVKVPKSNEVFRLLVGQVKDYAIYMLNTEGYILTWNEGARRINGYEADEIIGRHFSLFYSQQDRENEKPAFELRMAREMGRYEEEGWRIRKDGSRFWANVVVTPLKDDDGNLAGFAKVTRDLTQRKLQEDNIQRLLEAEERFRLLVDQVKDYAIFILDAKGQIASWNQGAKRLKGYSSDEVLGKHFSIFYTPADQARDHPAHELSLAISEGRYEEEGWRVRKDGSRFWANVVITSLWDKRGNLTGFAKVTRDLTTRKMQEDALRRKTEELENFAHTLSHDLRAPLRSIYSYGQILREEATNLSESNQGYLEKILASADAMDRLITDILKLSQLSMAPTLGESLDLAKLLHEVIQLQENEIKRTGAVVHLAEPLPPVHGNRTLVSQIFSNLLANALKFTGEGKTPRIEFFGEQNEETCQIHVKDNGPGIPEKFQQSVFNLFDRGGAQRSSGGTGIGLAIVKKAVERLGGSISIASKVGEGSDFIVTLPCHILAPAEATAQPSIKA